jgi:transposase
MRAYSMDLRVRVLADCDDGLPASQVARQYRVSKAWVNRLRQRRRQTGAVAPRKAGNPRRPALEARADEVRRAVAAQPDATLAELRRRLRLTVSAATLCRFLRRQKLTVKKKSAGPPSRTAPT